MRRVVRGLGLALVVGWALYCVVLTGSEVLNTHASILLGSSPAEAQTHVGPGWQQATAQLDSVIPHGDRVLLVVEPVVVLGQYDYFWATYWLYPRPVTVASDIGGLGSVDAIIYVKSGPLPKPSEPPGFSTRREMRMPDGSEVWVFLRRSGA